MKIKTKILPYQEKAVEKLLPLKVGALLMEMGTGKTRTTLELIHRRIEKGKLEHVLWLCPCSVRENLKEDIQKHTEGGLTKIAIYGIESLSSSIRLYEKLLEYVQARITMLVVDESILTKNFKTIRTQRIISLSEYCKYRLILNGTPISRTEADLFGQFYILDWRILGYRSFWAFAANHLEFDEKYKHKVRRVLNIDYLTDKIAPYSYMVKKTDVLNLQTKRYSRCSFEMSEEQRKHYIEMRDEFLDTLIDENDEAAIYRTFTALQDITSGRKIISKVKDPIKHVPFYENVYENPRINLLLETLEEINEKVIIWCKFQHEIDDIQKVFSEKYGENEVQIFCGKSTQRAREKAIKKFRENACFLIANKTCAGFGLNLQFCNKAIYYNNDWSFATRIQSEDRLHRMGQEKEVKFIDLYAENTIDRQILRCLDKKENIANNFRKSITSKNVKQWLSGVDLECINDKTGLK